VEDSFTVTAKDIYSDILDVDVSSDSELKLMDPLSGSSSVELTRSTGGTFSLHSLVVESFGSGGKTHWLEFTSDLGGSHTVKAGGTIDFDSSSVVGDTKLWDEVSTITINYYTSSGGFISTVDSIVVTAAVPEPSSMVLLWAAVGLGWAGRCYFGQQLRDRAASAA
jgi:hypothetical protein